MPKTDERPDDLVFVCQRCHGTGIEFEGEKKITCKQCGGHGYFDEEERLRWHPDAGIGGDETPQV